MPDQPSRRVIYHASPEEKERLRKHRQSIAQELPDLIERDRKATAASKDNTLSGALRRAVHHSGMQLAKIASDVGIDVIQLSDFLTGEQTLPSDVMDRLATLLGCELKQAS